MSPRNLQTPPVRHAHDKERGRSPFFVPVDETGCDGSDVGARAYYEENDEEKRLEVEERALRNQPLGDNVRAREPTMMLRRKSDLIT
jgi:hypothetical protein